MALYNWFVVGTGKLAPIGWHIPSNAELDTLIYYLGGDTVAGGKMKTKGTIEAGTGLWNAPNTGATNESGFSAIPVCYRGWSGSFIHSGEEDVWWMITESIYPDNAFYWFTNWWRNSCDINYIGTLLPGNSIRCIKDN